MFDTSDPGKLSRVTFTSRRVASAVEMPVPARERGGQQLAPLIVYMALLNEFGIIALALGCAFVALWRSRRAPAAAKLAHVRGFVSDRDARDAHALVRWDDDGGANHGGPNAAIL